MTTADVAHRADPLDFAVPPELEAFEPPEVRLGRRDAVRMMVSLGTRPPVHAVAADLPGFLDLLSRVAPMRYAVDLVRNVYYSFQPSDVPAEVSSAPANLAVIGAMAAVFVVVGTARFVRSERNR